MAACVSPAAAASDFVDTRPVDRSESRAAHEELVQARRAYVRARVAHRQTQRRPLTQSGQYPRPTQTRARASFPDSDLQSALEHDVAVAIAQFHQSRRPLLAAVRADPEYRAMAAARDDIRRAIGILVAEGDATDDAMLDLAGRAMEIGCRMTRRETLALARDSEVEEARLTMTETFARLRQHLDAEHVATGMPPRTPVVNGPPPTELDLEAARYRVEAANRRLADALLHEAALEQVRMMRLNQRRNGPPISMFGHR